MAYHRKPPATPSWSPRDIVDTVRDDGQEYRPGDWRNNQPPPWSRHSAASAEFPFWKLALAIAAGVLIAATLVWVAVEMRARHELRQLETQLRDFAREAEADLQRTRQRQAEQQRLARQRQAADAQARRQAEAARDRRPLLKQGTSAMPAGTIACMFGYRSQRKSDGGWQQMLINGQAQPCRSG